jgi:hypothetical protein
MPTFQQWPKITYKKQGVLLEAHSMVFSCPTFVAKMFVSFFFSPMPQLVQGATLTLLVK